MQIGTCIPAQNRHAKNDCSTFSSSLLLFFSAFSVSFCFSLGSMTRATWPHVEAAAAHEDAPPVLVRLYTWRLPEKKDVCVSPTT